MQEKLFEIIREAGRIMLEWQDPAVYEKVGAANYVTEADLAVQRFLLEKLAKIFPEAAFFAEEKEDNRLGDGFTFIIDPIDGTTNYIRRRESSVISVGAVVNREPVLGVIYHPYTDRMYWAEKGKGAFCDGQRLQVSQLPAEKCLIELGTSPYDRKYAPLTGHSVMELLNNFGDLRRSGSAAIDLLNLASGKSDGFFEWNLQPWDYCAASLLITEAGGKCGSILGGPVSFERGMPFMAGTPECYTKLQQVLQACLKEYPDIL